VVSLAAEPGHDIKKQANTFDNKDKPGSAAPAKRSAEPTPKKREGRAR
jgi:hypothetical protein